MGCQFHYEMGGCAESGQTQTLTVDKLRQMQ